MASAWSIPRGYAAWPRKSRARVRPRRPSRSRRSSTRASCRHSRTARCDDSSSVRLPTREAALKIGIAGTGRMGSALAGRLLGLGHEVTVWNRTRDKTKALESAGAKAAATPAELATRCEIVITILTHGAAVEATYGGPNDPPEGGARGSP